MIFSKTGAKKSVLNFLFSERHKGFKGLPYVRSANRSGISFRKKIYRFENFSFCFSEKNLPLFAAAEKKNSAVKVADFAQSERSERC
jgi:hypothetical protein